MRIHMCIYIYIYVDMPCSFWGCKLVWRVFFLYNQPDDHSTHLTRNTPKVPVEVPGRGTVDETLGTFTPRSCKVSSPLKVDSWKMNFLLGWPIFRGELLVSERVIAGLIKGNQWLISPDHKALFLRRVPGRWGIGWLAIKIPKIWRHGFVSPFRWTGILKSGFFVDHT